SVVTRYAYDIFGDTISVNYSNQDRMFEAIKLPVEVLKDTKVRAEFSVIKEKSSFDMNIVKNMKIQASNEYSDRNIVATNKPTSDVLLTNKDHFNTISDDVFASYSISLNNIQNDLEIGFTDQKEIFIIFDKGNSDEVYWNNKNFTKVSNYISIFNNFKSKLYIIENMNSDTLVNDEYKLVKKGSISRPTLRYSVNPEDSDTEFDYFSGPVAVKIVTTLNYEVEYEFLEFEEGSVSDLYTEYEGT